MLKRTVTGAIYVAIIVGFFFLRDYVDYRLFNILTFAFCAIGTFEVARAVKPYLQKGNFTLAVIYGAAFVPVFCVFEYFTRLNGAIACVILTEVLFFYQWLSALIRERNVGVAGVKNVFKSFAVNVLPFLYPALLLLTMVCANELDSGFICLVLIFAVSPCADTFAYLVGMTYNKIRKGKAKKMCPNLSPKKTWAGAIGGVIGGIAGAVVVYFAVDKTVITETAKISPIIAFVLIGFFASVLTEIGDLFESYIKRKVGIKDMGRILPGHGGIMDRIDGMSFAAVFVFLTFLLLL